MLFDEDAKEVDIKLDSVDRRRITELTLAMAFAANRALGPDPMGIEEATWRAAVALYGPFQPITESLGGPVSIIRRIDGWEIIVDPWRLQIRRQRA